MKLKEKMKQFWTLNVHNHEGFTLVELIIVIAILAILSSVAVVGYSSYVTKANMQADRTLVAEVANALQLAYYNDYENATGDYVILTQSGAIADGDFANSALEAAFGSNLGSLAIQYDGWQSGAGQLAQHYASSSFNGKTNELLGTVDELTTILADFLENDETIAGNTFKNYIASKDILLSDSTSAANAAVTYVAERVSSLKPEDQKKVVDALLDIGRRCAIDNEEPPKAVLNTMNAVNAVTNNYLSTAALLYAFAEAYCIYEGAGQTVNVDYTNVKTSKEAALRVVKAFSDLIMNTCNTDPMVAFAYFGYTLNGETGALEQASSYQALTDANAIVSAMGAIDAAAPELLKNVDSETCYSGAAASNLIDTYIAAAAAYTAHGVTYGVLVVITADGAIIVDPEELLK